MPALVEIPIYNIESIEVVSHKRYEKSKDSLVFIINNNYSLLSNMHDIYINFRKSLLKNKYTCLPYKVNCVDIHITYNMYPQNINLAKNSTYLFLNYFIKKYKEISDEAEQALAEVNSELAYFGELEGKLDELNASIEKIKKQGVYIGRAARSITVELILNSQTIPKIIKPHFDNIKEK